MSLRTEVFEYAGTADWFHRHGWGTVVSVDIDGASIEYARHRYSAIDFLQLDVVQIESLDGDPFDIAYLFNSFYAFPDQRTALRAIRTVCKPGALLLMYDYSQPTGGILPEDLGSEIGKPIVLDQVGTWLAESKWALSSVDDWTDRYVTQYEGRDFV
jgi:ubiquinone/menaquinone biosynthesis C-methylase UbiE